MARPFALLHQLPLLARRVVHLDVRGHARRRSEAARHHDRAVRQQRRPVSVPRRPQVADRRCRAARHIDDLRPPEILVVALGVLADPPDHQDRVARESTVSAEIGRESLPPTTSTVPSARRVAL